MDKPGRIGDAKKVSVHKGKVLDVSFNPFISTMLATASEDCYVKVTVFADGMPDHVREATVTLAGHQKKVAFTEFHPTAANVLASASFDGTVKVWDVESGSQMMSFDNLGDAATCLTWNSNGSLLGVSSKNKKFHLFDPRAPDAVVTTDGFSGSKAQSLVFLDNHGKIAAVGSDRQANRQLAIYDPKNFSEAVNTVDLGGGAGQLMMHYNQDNSVLYLCGKGDTSMKYYEVVDDEPYVHHLSAARASKTTKGMCFIPKKACDVESCEIDRCLLLSRDEVIPYSMRVPRKSDLFQADLFPDTYAGTSMLSAAEWAAGENKEPAMRSMKPGEGGDDDGDAVFVAKKPYAVIEKELADALAKIAELEAKLAQ